MFKKIIIILVLLLSLQGCKVEVKQETNDISDNLAFEEFLEFEFLDTMYNDIITLSFGLNDYSSFNMKKPEVTLGSPYYTKEDIAKQEDFVRRFEMFDYETLSNKQKLIYDKLDFNIQASKEIFNYQEFSFNLRPSSGDIENIKTIFIEYRLSNQERLDDYLVLLADIDRYLNEVILIVEKQAKSGFYLNDTTINSTIKQLDKLLSDNGLLVFTKGFEDKLEKVEYINSEEKNEYINQNNKIIDEEVKPIINELKNTLEESIGSSIYDGAIANYPNGKKYYEYMFKNKSSSSISVDDAYDLLNNELYLTLKEYSTLKIDTKKLENLQLVEDPKIVIDSYIENYSTVFPSINEINYQIELLDSAYTSDSVLGYYLIPPYDNSDLNSIKINPNGYTNVLDLHNTLAHEAVPGHLLQNNYLLLNRDYPLDYHISFIGSSEGYAMYVSKYAYLWIDGLDEDTAKSLYLDKKFGYILSSLLDIAVNYYGYTSEELKEEYQLFMQGVDYEELRISITEEPLMIIPYGLGMTYYDNFYRSASDSENFDIIEFHKLLLDYGNAPIDMIQKEIDLRYK